MTVKPIRKGIFIATEKGINIAFIDRDRFRVMTVARRHFARIKLSQRHA